MNVINLHLTNLCNYSCTYCFGKFSDKNTIDYERCCKIVDNISQYFKSKKIKGGRINIAGGEPLLCPYLDELIEYINMQDIKVSIITNASLLTVERIKSWTGRVSCIGISVDSLSEETNLKIGRCCKQKTLTIKQIVRVSQAIHKAGIKLKINTVVSALNIDEDFTELYKRTKPDKIKLIQMSIVNGTNDHASNLAVKEKGFKHFCKKYKHTASKVVIESNDEIQNSYLMINPQGEVQLNNNGTYETYGNCLKDDFGKIMQKVPFDENKFNSRNNIKTKDSQDKPKKKILAFGGFEKWYNSINSLVGEVTFFKSGVLRGIDKIRYADEVWIQTNAISHSYYAKIISVAKKNKIPVRYFTFDSAKKCAEQMKLSS